MSVPLYTQLYIDWINDRYTKRLPPQKLAQLSELYWDYIDIIDKPVESDEPRISNKRNRWVKVNDKLKLLPDERLVREFRIGSNWMFQNGHDTYSDPVSVTSVE